jgi:hypothetical protein
MTGKTDRVIKMQKLRHAVTRASTPGTLCRWSGMAQAILVPPALEMLEAEHIEDGRRT